MSGDLSVDLTTAVSQIEKRFFAKSKSSRGSSKNGSSQSAGETSYTGETLSSPLTDSEVIEKASSAKNGGKFTSLYVGGDLSAYGNDASKADAAMARILAYYLWQDPERIERVMRLSALLRDKWDEHPTYLSRTIAAVLNSMGSDPKNYWSKDGKSKAQDEQASESNKEEFRSWFDDEIENMPPPEWLVDGYLLKNSIAVIHGPSESGKSVLSLDVSMSVQTGTDFHDQKVAQGPTVYVAAEGAEGQGARTKAWKKERNLTGRQGARFVFDSVDFMNTDQVDKFSAYLRTLPEPPVLVVLDTWAWAMAGGDENSVKDTMQALKGVKAIRKEFGATVLLIHHDTKDGRAERGSISLRNAADTMISQSVDKGTITLRVNKQKDAPKPKVRYFKLKTVQLGDSTGDGDDQTIDTNTSVVLEAVAVAKNAGDASLLNDIEREILNTLQKLNDVDGPVTTSVWETTCGIPRTSFYRNRVSLLTESFVEQVGSKYQITAKGKKALAPLNFETEGFKP